MRSGRVFEESAEDPSLCRARRGTAGMLLDDAQNCANKLANLSASLAPPCNRPPRTCAATNQPSATAVMESSLPAGWPGVPVAVLSAHQPDIAELVAAVEPRTTKLVEEGNCRWTYAGTSGPANWGEMCEKKFATCGTGKMQSPIDVSSYDVIAYTERFLNVARFVLCIVSSLSVCGTVRTVPVFSEDARAHTHTRTHMVPFLHTGA